MLATRARSVADVTGAGDMFLAMLAAARAAGATWADATALANVASGLEVERFGAQPVTPDEIVAELLADAHTALGKRRTVGELLPELQRHRAAGRRVVFTNGCFDLIHLGHVTYFRFAKSQGDLLVVGVNTDTSIQRLKGDKRPIIALEDRLGVLEELESIDYLVTFDDDTPLSLIEQIGPDVLVKGADYAKEQVVGWDVVEARGGGGSRWHRWSRAAAPARSFAASSTPTQIRKHSLLQQVAATQRVAVGLRASDCDSLSRSYPLQMSTSWWMRAVPASRKRRIARLPYHQPSLTSGCLALLKLPISNDTAPPSRVSRKRSSPVSTWCGSVPMA